MGLTVSELKPISGSRNGPRFWVCGYRNTLIIYFAIRQTYGFLTWPIIRILHAGILKCKVWALPSEVSIQF